MPAVDKTLVHKSQCCLNHGCKYDDKDCPVMTGAIQQDHPCETCDSNGIMHSHSALKVVDSYELMMVAVNFKRIKMDNSIAVNELRRRFADSEEEDLKAIITSALSKK